MRNEKELQALAAVYTIDEAQALVHTILSTVEKIQGTDRKGASEIVEALYRLSKDSPLLLAAIRHEGAEENNLPWILDRPEKAHFYTEADDAGFPVDYNGPVPETCEYCDAWTQYADDHSCYGTQGEAADARKVDWDFGLE